MSVVHIVCLSLGGPHRRIVAGGREYRFEMHPHCGPIPLTKRGDIAAADPGRDFWKAIDLWVKQGKRVESDGTCRWEFEPPPKVKHLGGGHYVFVRDGDDPATGEDRP